MQIVAKQSDKAGLSEELNRISVCNDPTGHSWSAPEGSFTPSNSGVLLVIVNGHGAEEVRSAISELTLQAIKYAVHESSDDWDKMTEAEVLESAIYFAHEQIVGFKRGHPEFNNASADVSVALIKNHKIYLSWIGKGGIFKYSERSFDVIAGPGNSPKLELLTQVNTSSQADEEEPLVLSFDEPMNFETQYVDEIGVPAYVPMIKTRVESVYQNDIILGLTEGLAALKEERILEIVGSNVSSSNQIVQSLLAAVEDSGQEEGVAICKVVQGKQLALPVRKAIPPLGEELVSSGGIRQQRAGKKSNFALNAFVIALVFMVIIAQWHFSRNGEPDNLRISAGPETTVPEEKIENLILLMADESELGLDNSKTQAADEDIAFSEIQYEKPAGVQAGEKEAFKQINIQRTDAGFAKESNEHKERALADGTVKHPQKEENETGKSMGSGKNPVAVKEKTLDPELASLLVEFNMLEDKVNMMMDWEEATIKSQKRNVLKIVNEGRAHIGKDKPAHELLRNANDEFRKLQRLATQKLYEEE